MTTDARPTPALWLTRAAIVGGWAMILAGLGLFGWDGLTWLRDGAWHHASLADLWGHDPLGGDRPAPGWEEMRGLHLILFRVLHWFGRFPIGFALILIGLGVAWTANGIHDRLEAAAARPTRRVGAR